jgi:hypothetical protein
VTLWLSDAELTEMTEISESATEFLDDAMNPHDDVCGELDDGGWELDIQNASLAADNGGWRLTGRVTITYLAEPLLTRAGLEAYLLSPFDSQPRIHTLRAGTRHDSHRSRETQARPGPRPRRALQLSPSATH